MCSKIKSQEFPKFLIISNKQKEQFLLSLRFEEQNILCSWKQLVTGIDSATKILMFQMQ